MPIGELAATLFLGSGLIAHVRSWSERGYLLFGTPWLILGVTESIRFGLRPAVILGPISGTDTMGALLVGIVAWADALGLPRRAALATGIGIGSRAGAFENRLIAGSRNARDALDRASKGGPDQGAALRRVKSALDHLQRLRAPDPAWAQMRDEIVGDVQTAISFEDSGDLREWLAEHAGTSSRLRERWILMHEQVTTEQRELVSPLIASRHQGAWFGTFGVALLLMGAGGFPEALQWSDPLLLWPSIVLAVSGLALLAGAVLLVAKHGFADE